MDTLIEYLPLLLPLILLELALLVAALVHALRHDDYRMGGRAFWVVVIVCLQIIGPVAYFIFGRGEADGS
ncbi:MAG: PLD nuclease N-terminal domain-containing protein [Oscillospiraceae bacterium]|nr:PLD nuclease N-terminal domain-containing protein [Oscillospiraceae bacterium]